MSDIFWPSVLVPYQSQIDILDGAGRFVSPISGFARAVARPGTRTRLTMSFRALTGNKSEAYRAAIAAIRGYNPVFVHDHSYEQSGSFAGDELLSNNTFEDSTTGWSVGSNFTATVSKRSLQASRNAIAAGTVIRNSSPITAVAFAPYVARFMVEPGRGTFSSLSVRAGSSAGGNEYGSTSYTDVGMLTHAFVPYSTDVYVTLRDAATSGQLAGDYLRVKYISLARCALIDNGANYLLNSSNLEGAEWSYTRSSVQVTPVTLPDGTSGVASIHEDTSSANTHFVSQNVTVPSAQADYCFAVAVHAANRTWARVGMVEQTDNTIVAVYINLTTGALSSPATGASWADLRTSVVNLGDGWWDVSVIARKTNAATTITGRVWIAEGDNDITFTGLDQNSIRLWRPSLAQSSVPMRLTATTDTAHASGQDQNLGGGIYTKGWPASTNAILEKGDEVQIGNQLLIVEDAVNSDAAGCATLLVGTLRAAPDDNAPVIISRPMGRFLVEPNENSWSNLLGGFMDAEIVLSEAA